MIQLKEIGLTFEADGKHIHRIGGDEVPGCTSISGLFGDDGWKFAWPPKLMYEEIVKEGLAAIEKGGNNLSFEELEAIAAKAKNAWRRKRDKSADTGTIAHGEIEKFIATGVVPSLTDKEVMNCFNQFLLWTEKHNPKWLASELQVGSKVHGFAGILDAIAEIDGKKILLDFKTSSGIKDEYRIQLAGLRIALEEQGFAPEESAILHLPKEGKYEYRKMNDGWKDEEMDFLVALAFYKRKCMFAGRHKNGR